MQVLTISDEVVPAIYSLNVRERFGTVQLVLGCGDLPYYYMEFILTTLGVPGFFVHGNHDKPELTGDGSLVEEPRGWISLEGRCVYHEGLLIGGLGGSIRYNKGNFQYSESEMMARALLLAPRLMLNKQRHGRYLDALITHSPPKDIQDGQDRAHRGFLALRYLIERFQPRYMIHGHVHRSYGFNTPFETQHGKTQIINTAGYRLLQLEPKPVAGAGRLQEGSDQVPGLPLRPPPE